MKIFKKDYIVGLDIGSSSVKLAQFAEKEDGLHLVRADLREIKHTGDVVLREKETVSAIKDLFREIEVKKSAIVVNINCPMTSMKRLIVPYMPKAELREGLRLKAKNHFPFPIDTSLLDFEILGDVVEGSVRKFEVAMAASPRKTIDAFLSLLEKAGVKPASLVPCSYAFLKLAENLSSGEGKTRCFVDIGERYTELLVFKGKDLAFSRKIPVAGRDFTRAMTGALVSDRGKTELSLYEAEKIKREIGIPPDGESRIIDNKISTIQVLSMLRTPLERLVNEIDRCFDYYREESGGEKIESLILFGGGAALGGLAKFISEGLGIEAKLGDALDSIKIESGTIAEKGRTSYRLEMAIGAALGGTKGVNLLPPEIKEETKRLFKRATVLAVSTAVILISILLYIGMIIKLSSLQKRIEVANLELSSLQSNLRLTETQSLLNKALANEPYWEDVFKEIGNVIPESIYLTEISMKKGIIKMKGIVSSEAGLALLSDFILSLEEGIFKNVKLVESKELEEEAATRFEIKFWID